MAAAAAAAAAAANTFSLLFFLLVIATLSLTSAASTSPNSTNFIGTSCTSTLYPSLCLSSLSRFAPAVGSSPVRLARVAAKIAASKIRSASARVSAHRGGPCTPREAAALRDCADTLREAAERTRQSVTEIGMLDGSASRRETAAGSVAWRVSNAQTWMSGAITDEATCTDGFDAVAEGSLVKADVVRQVGMVKQYTSNALALVNNLVHDSP